MYIMLYVIYNSIFFSIKDEQKSSHLESTSHTAWGKGLCKIKKNKLNHSTDKEIKHTWQNKIKFKILLESTALANLSNYWEFANSQWC